MKMNKIYPAMALAMTGVSATETIAQEIERQKCDARPNVIIIMTDQQRFDCIGAVNDAIKTPNIDALAQDGILFRNAYVESPSSTPARSVLLTGMTPWHTGMIGYYGKVAEKYPTEMPRMLTEAGYYTIGLGKMHWYPQRNGHGFETLLVDESGRVETEGFVSDYRQWFAKMAPGQNPDETGIGWNEHNAKIYALPEELHPTRWTGNVAVEHIENYDMSKPLFLKVSFARPHSPYDPPQRYLDMYKDVEIPAPWKGEWSDRFADFPNTKDAPFGDFTDEHAIESRRHYYALITFIDDEIGRIIRSLKDKGLYDNSVIIFTSDHGDMLGDHHHWRKTYSYEGSSHIPFIMKAPHGMGGGSEREQCVGFRDILPTFLDAARVQIPEAIDGSSLLSLINNPRAPWRECIEFEHSVSYNAPFGGWVAIADGKMKYTWFYNTGIEQLFDMGSDPHELRCVANDPQYAEVLEKCRARMVEKLTERGEEWVKDGKLQINEHRTPLNKNFPRPQKGIVK